MTASRFGKVLARLCCAAGLVLAAAGPAQADPTGGKTVFNVRWFYSTSWDQAIADAVAAAKDSMYRYCNGAIIYFPEGLYTVTQTIDLDGLPSGLNIAGAGATPFPSPLPPDPLSCPSEPSGPSHALTMIKMSASDDRPLFLVRTTNVTFTDLILEGADPEKKEDFSQTTLVQTQSNPSLGACTSTLAFRQVFFRLGDRGIALATEGNYTDWCNSELVLERTAFIGCRIGLRANTWQAGNIVCYQTGAVGCPSVFDFEEGPINFAFNTGTFTGCGGEGDDEWIFNFRGGGPNSGNAKIENAHFDVDHGTSQPCRQFVRLTGDHIVTMETSIQQSSISGLGVGTPPTSYDPIFEVRSGSLVVSNSRFFSYPLVELKNTQLSWLEKSIRFRDCALPTPGSPFSHASLYLNSHSPAENFALLFDACTATSFAPIARWTNVVGW